MEIKLITSLKYIVTVLAVSLGVSHLNGCGGAAADSDKRTSNDFERPGSHIGNTELRYYDARPSMSADGSLVIFVSGRDGSLRTYLSELNLDDPASTADPRPLLNGDSPFESELAAVISPDGRYAVLTAIHPERGSELHLVSMATRQTTLIDESVNSSVKVSIANDSSMLAYVVQKPGHPVEILLREVNQDLELSDAMAVKLGDSRLGGLVLAGDASAYQMLVLAQQNSGASSTLMYRFVDLSSATSAEPMVIMADLRNPVPDVLSLDSRRFTFLRRETSREPELILASGDKADEEKTRIARRNHVVAYELLSESASDVTLPGYETLQVATNSAGDLMAGLVRNKIECNHLKDDFGTMMTLGAPGEWRRLVPWYDSTSSWTMSDQLCSPEGAISKRDVRIFSMALNADALAEKATIVYVTGFSVHEKQLGAHEVFAAVIDGERTSVVSLSRNPSPDPD